MIVKSYAKINSILYVLGKRDDGYHELFSLMHKIDLYDWISIKKTSNGLSVKTNIESLNNERNLAFRAAKLFFERSGIKPQVAIEIEKQIPMGGGLGGGSSNAGYVLRSLNSMFDYPLGDRELFSIAEQIGSDVPFFLVDGSAIVRGRGEIVEKIKCCTENFQVFIVIPDFSISTAHVYGKLVLTNQKRVNKMALTVGGECNIRDIATRLHNDLEQVVLNEFALLKKVKERLVETFGCGLVSGSGSTVFSIIGSEVAREGRLKDFCLSEGFFCKTVKFSE